MTAPLFDNLAAVREHVQHSKHLLLALDFDGTLAPICEHPQYARLPDPTCRVLRTIAAQAGTWLAIVSGRSIEDLRARVRLDIIFAGNHGFEIGGPEFFFRHPAARDLSEHVRAACSDVAARLSRVPGVFVENKGLTGTVHYRLAPASAVAEIHRLAEIALSPYGRLVLLPALRAWEIRPRLDWNKGSAVREIAGRLPAPEPLTICIGDDETDEDMFEGPATISIKVGSSRRTRASYFVESAAEVRTLLHLIHRWTAANHRDCGCRDWRACLASLRSALQGAAR